jgi:hypothetical protein
MHRSSSRIWKPAFFAFVSAWIAPSAGVGQITDFRVETYQPEPTVLAQFVVNDLFLDFYGPYLGSHLKLVLERGTVFEHPLGRILPPQASIAGLVPSLAFDSFLALGSPTAAGPFGDPIPGRSCPLGGIEDCPPGLVSPIDWSWFPHPQILVPDQSDFLTARITLSHDAHGTWEFIARAGDHRFETVIHPIRHGRLVMIPEPATAVLMIIAGPVLVVRRIRSM